MSKLRISEALALPLDAVTQAFAILAKRGAGKSYLASVLAEEMLKAGQQIVVVDPTGGWFGLRSGADGKSPGFPVVVLGGNHGDLPLEQHAGEVIGTAIAENHFSAILDLSLFRKGEMVRFMIAFAETLYRANREALHLFVDEADSFAPQGRSGFGVDENRMLGAMEDLVRRGRLKGIGCTLITQRPAVLNKSVLTQCESLFVLRMVHPRDINAIEEWVNVHADPEEAENVIADLPSLAVGTAWFWSPGWMGTLKKIVVRPRQTFDSSATPKPGEARKVPKNLAEVDLAKLGNKIQDSVVKAKENDPKELKRQIAELKKQLQARGQVNTVKPDTETLDRVKQQAKLQAEREWLVQKKHLEKELSQERAKLAKIAVLVGGTEMPAVEKVSQGPAEPRPRSRLTPPLSTKVSGNGQATEIGQSGLRRILTALAQKNDLSAKQVGVRAGMSSSSGTFGTYLGQARSNGWIEGGRERLHITDAGVATLGHYDPLPIGQELLNYWLADLGDSGAARMLRAVAEAYPRSLSKDELAEKAGMSNQSGTFGTYLGKLRTLELVEGKSELRASEELFD